MDRDALRVAKAALNQVDRLGPRDGELAVKYDEYTKLAETAVLAIEKEAERRAALERMREAVKARTPMLVYAEHRKLYGRYPDLKMDGDSQTLRSDARKIELESTKFTPSNETGAPTTAATPAAARPPIRLTVLGDAKAAGKVSVVQAADTVFGFDIGSGEVKWQYPVGFNPAFPPTSSDAGVLIHRTLDQSLLLIDAETGKEVWSTALGQRVLRFISRPLVYQGRIYISGFDAKDEKTGRLFVFGLDSGRGVGSYSFPQPLAGMPVLDSKRRQLLLPGEQATIYFINPNNNQCTSVQPIGHEPGTLAWVPMLPGRFLFTVENIAPDKSLLRAFVLSSEDGLLREKPIGDLGDLPGSVRREPVLKGTRLFVTTNRDAFLAFDLGAEDDEKPMQRAARFVPPSGDDSPIALAPSERQLWLVGKKLRNYEIRTGVAEPRRVWETTLPGPPAMRPFFEGETLIVCSQNGDNHSVQVVAVDSATQKEKWRLDLVLPPKTVQLDPKSADSLVLNFESGPMTVSMKDLAGAQPLQLPPESKEKSIDPEPNFEEIRGWNEGVVQWSGIGGRFFRSLPSNLPEKRFALTSPAAAPPGLFGKGVLLPCQDGMIYWIDPKTGVELAEPFGVPFVEGQPVELGAVVGLDQNTAVAIAGVMLTRFRLTDKPFSYFKEASRVEFPDAPDVLTTNPDAVKQTIARTHMARVGDSLFVATNRKLFRLRPDDLSVVETTPIGGNVLAPPTSIGGIAVFETDRRELIAVGPASTGPSAGIRWRLKLDRPALGPPRPVADRGFWLAYPNGELVEHRIEDGKAARTLSANRSLFAGPWVFAGKAVAVTPTGGVVTFSTP